MHVLRATATEAPEPVMLHVGGEEWRFSITGVTRVGRGLFISVMLQGRDICTAVIHVRDRIVLGVTARDILEHACEWLKRRGSERHVYIDLAESFS